MNINPYSPITPHYDSYEDFYKFFEVSQKDVNEDVMPIEVFPPVERMEAKKREERVKPRRDKKDSLTGRLS